MNLSLVIRSIAVAVAAALIVALPVASLLTIGMDWPATIYQFRQIATISLVGCIAVGFPISILVFFRIAENPSFGLIGILGIANMVAILLALLLIIFAGAFGVIFFGLPLIAAANAFAILGWFVIVKPHRASLSG